MRRQYFVHYYNNFGNTYSLFYADSEAELKLIPENADRITRKRAESLAADENYRRKYDSSCSGYADNAIYPAGMSSVDRCYIEYNDSYFRNGYIWEHK